MRWYWLLLLLVLTGLSSRPVAAEGIVRHVLPVGAMHSASLLLILLAALALFAALVLSSRRFAVLALLAGAGVFWLQPGYWNAVVRNFDRFVSGAQYGANLALPIELQWLVALGLATLLLTSALAMHTKVE